MRSTKVRWLNKIQDTSQRAVTAERELLERLGMVGSTPDWQLVADMTTVSTSDSAHQ